MTAHSSTGRYLASHPRVSASIYLALLSVLCLTTVFLLMDTVERHHARSEALELLGRLQGRTQLTSSDSESPLRARPPPGSPVLEGPTSTVASAALLQRITSAITQAGGSVISTEVEAQRPQSKDGFLKVLATCDIPQSALQQLLYDVEGGMPFLFVDQLTVQTPTTSSESGLMRVLIGVSGLWPGAN
jgi:general secretion pathway protein M